MRLMIGLMRHGAALAYDPEAPNSGDFERPLAANAQQQFSQLATGLSQFFGDRQDKAGFDIIYHSTAKRCQQTQAGIRVALDQAGAGQLIDKADIHPQPDFYDASPGDLLAHIHHINSTYKAAILIGHNPSIAALAHGLARKGPNGNTDGNIGGYKAMAFTPASFVIYGFACDKWRDIAPYEGELLWQFSPNL